MIKIGYIFHVDNKATVCLEKAWHVECGSPMCHILYDDKIPAQCIDGY